MEFFGSFHFTKCDENIGFVKNFLKKENRVIKKLEEKPWIILPIPDKRFLVLNYDKRALKIYDRNFNVLRSITKMNNKDIKASFVALGDNDLIYISVTEPLHRKVFSTDLEFNEIKAVTPYGMLEQPYDICFKNKYLYVCDAKKNAILILTEGLKFHKQFYVSYQPWLIKVTETIICVKDIPSYSNFNLDSYRTTTTYFNNENGSGLYFYDIFSFELKYTYKHGYSRISKIGLNIYECTDKKMFCYNESGGFVEEVKLDCVKDLKIRLLDVSLTNMKGDLYMALYERSEIIKFPGS